MTSTASGGGPLPSRASTTVQRAASAGTASSLTAARVRSASSEPARVRLASARKRWDSSERLSSVMSSTRLIASRTLPSASHTEVVLIRVQRSSPVSRSRERRMIGSGAVPLSAWRPGSWSSVKARPLSSTTSKRLT